jgi:hypothetical protein
MFVIIAADLWIRLLFVALLFVQILGLVRTWRGLTWKASQTSTNEAVRPAPPSVKRYELWTPIPQWSWWNLDFLILMVVILFGTLVWGTWWEIIPALCVVMGLLYVYWASWRIRRGAHVEVSADLLRVHWYTFMSIPLNEITKATRYERGRFEWLLGQAESTNVVVELRKRRLSNFLRKKLYLSIRESEADEFLNDLNRRVQWSGTP